MRIMCFINMMSMKTRAEEKNWRTSAQCQQLPEMEFKKKKQSQPVQ